MARRPPDPARPDHRAPAVAVEDLVVRYGDLVAVDGISFRATAGQVTAILGPNGAGKTSTVEVLEGYRRPAAGRARVLGLDPVAHHQQLVRRVGVMLQEGGVYTGIRPPEALHLFASYYDDPLDPDDLLERVGLGHRRRSSWRLLSGGERQRLSLALAVVGRPEVVFLDEPTAGIDPAGRRVVRDLVTDLRDGGVAVLLTTHDLDEAERLADRVVIIDHGRLLADGTPAELVRAGRGADGPTGGADELRFAAEPGLEVTALAGELGAAVAEDRPGEYVVATAPTPATVAALTAWLARHDLALADLRAGRQRLEDVFLRLTADAATERDDGATGDTPPGRGAGRRRGRRAR